MRQVKAYFTELVSRADGGGELPEIITMRRDVSQGSVICPRNKTHGAVVRNVLWATFLCIGHMVAKRQSIGATAVVRESANRLDQG